MQFTTYKTDHFPVWFCSRSELSSGKKTPMHKLGSQIQLWLRPSGCAPPPRPPPRPPARVMSTVQPLLGRLTGEGFPTATKEPLPTTRSAPGSSPALTFNCVTWMVSPTISDSNSTISDSKPPLPSNVIYCRVDVMCPHFCPCYLVLTHHFHTAHQQALCGCAAENGHWWLQNKYQSPALTLWYSDLVDLTG